MQQTSHNFFIGMADNGPKHSNVKPATFILKLNVLMSQQLSLSLPLRTLQLNICAQVCKNTVTKGLVYFAVLTIAATSQMLVRSKKDLTVKSLQVAYQDTLLHTSGIC
ncbi:hypothetical protein XENORESO_012633, partial [Xenotaenia resolanae]